MLNESFLLGYGAGKANGGGGSEPILVEKTITENGTYSATDDNADGYSSVTVNVSGGFSPEVPAGYTQMEYIANDGTAWVDTGMVWQDGDKLSLYGETLQMSGAVYWHPIGGNMFVQCGGRGLPYISATYLINSTGGNISGNFGTLRQRLDIEPTSISLLTFDGDAGGVYKTQTGTVTPTVSIALFARHKPDLSVDYPAYGYRIYRFKYYRGGALVQDLVPAMRDADSELGFYDIIGNQFLTNAAGRGALSGGAL